ncbi:hypothetical protein [Flavobacterium sp. MDT1-60]|uniref:hypothetical protein n=1 Tax=Flavobacterium sp. MDT1-60 TaxID=1979344 RepID=UPI001781156E|nr:hypothetical protein [Flavobacterium sp. MDT1-60]QOG03656.1 hypothetical protein IHE43_05340 [Flavobacterium sp. MDT1-60]
MKKISFLLISLLFVSCNSNRNFCGTYKSNFAQLGFFVTKIKFNADSTVKFNKAGDLMNEELTGKFKISRSNIVYVKFDKLKYEQPPDSLPLNELQGMPIDTNPFQNMHLYDLKLENGISYHLKYKIKRNKLLVYNIQTGKIVRRSKGSKNTAKFYLKKVAN